jgi:hypothetical protein
VNNIVYGDGLEKLGVNYIYSNAFIPEGFIIKLSTNYIFSSFIERNA